MWTDKSRGRVAKIAKKTKRYPTDLTDEEWLFIQPYLSKVAKRGRKPSTDVPIRRVPPCEVGLIA